MVLTRESERFRFVLETPAPIRLNGRESYLKGWFAPRSVENLPELAIVVDGITAPALAGFPRSDVSRHLNDPKVKNCGFLARFRTPRWDRNIKIYWRNESESVLLAHLKVNLEQPAPSRPDTGRVSDYESWLVHCEPLLFWPEDEIFERLAAMPQLPLISIILPTYNTPPYYLDRCIKSVRNQHYANWQLCVADDGSDDKGVLEYLQRAAAEDSRIQIDAGHEQSGISRASNRALHNAQGEFITLLDHDDELHPYALLEVVRHLNETEHCDLIYSDEDKIDLYGNRSRPTFKPDFDPDILLTFNYLGHLTALRRSVALDIGGFRPSSDGAQDWDLFLRAIHAIGPAAIYHLPKPLYHWRMHEESTSVNLLSKPYIRKAWIRVLSDHLERTGQTASIEQGTFFGSMRLRRPVPSHARIAVFVREEDGNYQFAVLEKNLDEQRTSVYCLAGSAVRSIRRQPAGDSRVVSLSEIAAEVLVFINGPLETVNHLFFEELAGQALRRDCGIVTGLSLNSAGHAIHTGLICAGSGELIDPFAGEDLSGVSYMRQLGVPRAVEAISDEFFAIRREQLEAVGGLSSVSTHGMDRLVRKLIRNARRSGLAVIVTPYAIATFDARTSTLKSEPVRVPRDLRIRLNANLSAFVNFTEVS